MKAFFSHVILFTLISATLLQGCQASSRMSAETRHEVLELERTIKINGEIISRKTAHISELRQGLQSAENLRNQYRICCGLLDEYYKFDLDSAIHYIYLKQSLARELGDRTLTSEAALDLANRYLMSGMYYSSKEILDSLGATKDFPPGQLEPFYRAQAKLYHSLVLVNKDPALSERFKEQELNFLDLSKPLSSPNTLNYSTDKAESLIAEGQSGQARKVLSDFLASDGVTKQDAAIAHYWTAKAYRAEDNIDQALKHFAISARYDLEIGSRASRSIIQAAVLLLKQGQPERAYRFINLAYQDAVQADARVCLEEISQFMPDISSTYDQMNTRRIHELIFALVLVAFLLIVSITGIVLIRSLQKRVLKANQEIKSNLAKMKEANDIKDLYMGRYMSMFSSHINGIEQYRSSIRNVAKSKDLELISKALRSDEFIDNQRGTLYEEFDHAFLGMFPDFVSQLNSLLKEDQRIGRKLPEGKLNNELRIFALIRLGVTESAQIASFLKKSPSTIYNYRVKLRNASIYPHDEFEQHVMEIGNSGLVFDGK